ncbi:MAG: beta-galactosidase [Lachnospiraceae bacterium]
MKYLFQQYEAPVILYNHLNLGGNNPEGERIDVNSAYFTRNGKPWIPVMGEFHFSRYDRNDWYEELCKMKAGGITLVSTYLFWIYHEEIEGSFDFTGDNDIRAFIDQCKRAGLEVVIRIGPWAHGECRNGGLPDWLLKKPYKLRENNEAYLEQVKKWYSKIYEQVKGFFYQDGGNIVAIQLENEFCHDAAHLARLKEIAIDCGLVAPLYTVTGWNSAAGAKIPVDEVVPVFGGYCDAPWDHSLKQLPPSPHYFFNRMRNDSA